MPASPWIGSTRNAAVLRRDRRLERGGIAERHADEARRERAEAVAVLRFAREADDGRRPAGEVAGGDDDLGASFRHALDLVGPLARRLDRRLDGLGAGVHRQRLGHAGRFADGAQERTEAVGVEGAARHREALGLLGENAHEGRMAVAEADRGVRRHHVEVAAAGGVEQPDAGAALQRHRQAGGSWRRRSAARGRRATRRARGSRRRRGSAGWSQSWVAPADQATVCAERGEMCFRFVARFSPIAQHSCVSEPPFQR